MDRTKTGIQGLDDILHGGIPKGETVLISGGAGAGKTILTLQYIVNGARDYNEPGVFVSTEQSHYEIDKQAKTFEWDLDKLEKEKLFKFLRLDFSKPVDHLEKIQEAVESMNAKRLVIDSITTFAEFAELLVFGRPEGYTVYKTIGNVTPVKVSDTAITKILLTDIYDRIKKLRGVTTLVTSELLEGESKALSRDSVSEFLADGIIMLSFLPVGEQSYNNLEIRKLRYSSFVRGTHKIEFKKTGLVLEVEKEPIHLQKR